MIFNRVQHLQYFIFIAAQCTVTIAQICFDSQSRPGKCIAFTSCTSLIQDYKSNRNNIADFSMYLGVSICAFDGSTFLVCCPNQLLDKNSPIRWDKQPKRPIPVASATGRADQDTTLNNGLSFIPLAGNTISTWQSNVPTIPWTTRAPMFFQTISATSSSSSGAVFDPFPIVGGISSTAIGITPTQISVTPKSSECGLIRGTINRVVGGSEARRGSYPWIAALGYMDAGTIKYFCAGSLIASKYVVTSAHCINPQLSHVRLGAHNLQQTNEPGAINIGIKRTIIHEAFDITSITNDIALIEMTSPAPNPTTICLPNNMQFLGMDLVGMNPFIAGWGSTIYQGTTSAVLLEAQVPIVNSNVCEQSYKNVFGNINFNNRVICAGNSNVDACQGDSGGPLMIPQRDADGNYRFYLIGLVSYGYECARSGFPGVYTSITPFAEWLRTHII